jgi:hypothetical protein
MKGRKKSRKKVCQLHDINFIPGTGRLCPEISPAKNEAIVKGNINQIV